MMKLLVLDKDNKDDLFVLGIVAAALYAAGIVTGLAGVWIVGIIARHV